MHWTNRFRLVSCLLLGLGSFSSAQAGGRVTILYDAFGNAKNLKQDWGFSVLIEYSGRRSSLTLGITPKSLPTMPKPCTST